LGDQVNTVLDTHNFIVILNFLLNIFLLQFYVETVKRMAQRQFVSGSPLRTLCLLIAGQPADVFSSNTSAVPTMAAPYGVPNASQTMGVSLNIFSSY
jgi:hypothetical protein